MKMDNTAENILKFWFSTTDVSSDIKKSAEWFKATEGFDKEISRQFLTVRSDAVDGKLDHLIANPAECLALIIVLDQFSRNLFRNSPHAFEADLRAREVSRVAIERGYCQSYSNWPKIFCYLPFEHSESLGDHEFIAPHFEALEGSEFENSKITAREHMETIRKFGRYPHRNRALGRKNSQEEEQYLKNGPLWGKTKAEAEAIIRLRKMKK